MADGKVCSRCKEWKPFGIGFSKNASSPDGFYSICKACRKPVSKAWRQQPEVKAKETARLAASYQSRKDELAVRRKARWEANKEQEKARNAAYLELPGKREEHRARCRNWAKNHPEAMRIIVRKRRAAKLGAEGSHTPADIERLYANQHGKCVYCKSPLGDKYHVDHIHPLSRGGSNGPENLQLTCHICNRMKGPKLDWQFDRERYERLRSSQ